MLPALLGLMAPVVAVKALTQLARAAGAALRSATARVALPVPTNAEKAAEGFFDNSDSPVIFGYDGYGRRIKIAEFDNGNLTSKKLYWWLGGEIVCERDGIAPGFPITKRYFGQGVVVRSERLFYTFDQLGSVRELVDSTGVVRADYRYSTYGERTKVGGDLDSDWGYAGLFHHEPTGLDLATYRVYDSTKGRWLSRDPLGEGVDYNLYRYCGNDPIGHFDSTGLFKVVATGPMGERLKKALQRLRDKLKDKEREKNCNLTETGFTAPDLLRVIEDESITVDFGGKTGDPGHTFAETFTGADESGAIGSATQVYDDAAALTDEQLEGVLGHEGAHVLLNERRLKAQAIIKDNQRFKNAMKGAGINTMHPPHIFNTIDNAFPTGISYPNPEMPIFTP